MDSSKQETNPYVPTGLSTILTSKPIELQKDLSGIVEPSFHIKKLTSPMLKDLQSHKANSKTSQPLSPKQPIDNKQLIAHAITEPRSTKDHPTPKLNSPTSTHLTPTTIIPQSVTVPGSLASPFNSTPQVQSLKKPTNSNSISQPDTLAFPAKESKIEQNKIQLESYLIIQTLFSTITTK